MYGQDVSINEIMSSNQSIIADVDGDFSDWIELYNASDVPLNLFGYTLSDDSTDLKKWSFPYLFVPARSYLLVFASGKDKVQSGQAHTNFKIAQDGEAVYLCRPNGAVVSSLGPRFVPKDHSLASIRDGSLNRVVSENPSPNSTNNGSGGVYFSHSSGWYAKGFGLLLETSDSTEQIFYTTDGNHPTINSLSYSGPIEIKKRAKKEVDISFIPTTPLTGPSQLNKYVWKNPLKVNNCTVLRFASFVDGVRKSPVYTRTFFIDTLQSKRYSFPVVSLVADSLSLFDYDTGIYVPGRRFDIVGFDNWWAEGNYHIRGDWSERQVTLSYFDTDGTLAFEVPAGMRMRGYGSAALPQKPFTIYFRSEYGCKNVTYPVFENAWYQKHKRLIFRNGGGDFLYAKCRDLVVHDLIEEMDLEIQDSRPSVVFINGEYWGIHYIREKYDKFYFENKYGIDEDSVTILGLCGGVDVGDNTDYLRLVDFVETHDLSIPHYYKHVSQQIDINNFIDYQIAEIYFANYDWPCNNVKLWKSHRPGSKWRYLIYDMDASFHFDESSAYTTYSMEHATSTENHWPYCSCSNVIFRGLLENDEFEKQFLDRFSECLSSTFQAERVWRFLDDFEQLVEPEMQEQIDRWGYPPSMGYWKDELQRLRDFAQNRPCFMSEHLIRFFNLKSFAYDCVYGKDELDSGWLLFPNPTDGHFSIYNHSGDRIKNGTILLTNALGQLVFESQQFDIEQQERMGFDFSKFPNGMYVLTFSSNSVSGREKILIVK